MCFTKTSNKIIQRRGKREGKSVREMAIEKNGKKEVRAVGQLSTNTNHQHVLPMRKDSINIHNINKIFIKLTYNHPNFYHTMANLLRYCNYSNNQICTNKTINTQQTVRYCASLTYAYVICTG